MKANQRRASCQGFFAEPALHPLGRLLGSFAYLAVVEKQVQLQLGNLLVEGGGVERIPTLEGLKRFQATPLPSLQVG